MDWDATSRISTEFRGGDKDRNWISSITTLVSILWTKIKMNIANDTKKSAVDGYLSSLLLSASYHYQNHQIMRGGDKDRNWISSITTLASIIHTKIKVNILNQKSRWQIIASLFVFLFSLQNVNIMMTAILMVWWKPDEELIRLFWERICIVNLYCIFGLEMNDMKWNEFGSSICILI